SGLENQRAPFNHLIYKNLNLLSFVVISSYEFGRKRFQKFSLWKFGAGFSTLRVNKALCKQYRIE
ncbi:hypothetical protein LAM21_24480, partial [Mycobacterium tuberculosis]|nr:hypothetical protein [Mycobacterium tuberculosis]